MGSSLYLSMIMRLLSLLSCFHFIIMISSFSSKHPLCRDDERSALLQFNQSFSIDPYKWYVSRDPSAYPKTASWKTEESSDCCSWDGVECDNDTGHVIGLDLSSSFLYGSIYSSSSLFRLLHLQKLNLADNDFNYSQIPSRIGHLSRLTYLNLSSSLFSGPIPSKISELSKLAIIDLSFNVDISFEVPGALANFSSLTSLYLHRCGLHGDFPTGIFQLPNLHTLDVGRNPYLTAGYLPKFNKSSPLTFLDLSGVSFSGKLPDSIGNLNSLNELEISGCNYSGSVPSSLGKLTQLTLLDLSRNNFSGSVPSSLGKLTQLTLLGLSRNNFSGSVPSSLGKLTQLTRLDLSRNNFSGSIPSSLGKLTQLTLLRLSRNNFSGSVPSSLGKLTQLTLLGLSRNNFSGSVPSSLGKLTQLTMLDLSRNNFSGDIPSSLGNLTQLQKLNFYSNHLTGQIPSSLGKLTQLTWLDLSTNNFSGSSIQSSPGNLTAQLTGLNLSSIDLSNFSRSILAWVGKQTKLTFLGLANCSLIGEIPSSLRNLTQLDELHLYSNQLTGQIPSWLANLTKLTQLTLDSNQLHGPIPQSIFELQNLELLHLNLNHLSGTVDFDMFLNLKNLVSLQLSHNNLSLLTTTSVNATLRKFKLLGLAACNLSEFPDFLQHQDELEFLELSRNRIQGQIPKWIWNIGIETLTYMSVSYNFLTGFDHPPVVLPWTTLQVLNLESNLLQGSLLIPPPSTLFYLVSNNSLASDLSPLICSLTSLYVLDLSNNNLRGELPKCLGNFSDSLLVLNLRKNHFHGTIPQTYTIGSKLKMIDLSQNRLHGWVPRSLANCKMLEILNLGNNQMSDTFPFWLGTFQELRVLIMRSNAFHGAIKSFDIKFGFPKLRIIDLSCNMFSGKLPFEYFKNWNAMKIANADHLTYLQTGKGFGSLYYSWDENYKYSMTITNKGAETIYTSIPEIFTAIDLSSNSFEGGIPESIGDLKGLRLLNFSNNILTGCLPSCIGNLTNLESLDLSQNMLSGELPQQLTGLTFLAFLNVSHNHLTGPIPQGKQFDTFENNSFEGNLGLCGKPLSKKCGNSEASLPPSLTTEQDEDFKFPRGYDWIFILTGYGSGLVVGLVIGRTVTTRKHEWFVETFGRRPGKKKRVKRDARPTSGKLNVTTSSCNAIEATLELNGSGVGSSKNINKSKF